MSYSLGKIRHATAGNAMQKGIANSGDEIVTGGADAWVVFGWAPPASEMREAGLPVVTMDMAYFGRLAPGSRDGHHKVSVNHWHPTAYFQKVRHKSDRWESFRLPVFPMRKGGRGHIVVAGSGPKSNLRDGNEFQEWERWAIGQIADATDRPIIYRPKPYNNQTAQPIAASVMDDKTPILDLLKDAHCVITRQSNVAIDALRIGVPAFCWDGAASVLSLQDLGLVEDPRIPTDEERWQFFSDLAYCQWTLAEMETGTAWRHLKDEGLIQ
ncbi:MAG: hypothetical protein KG075_17560 [Alphaproteobacteria bacterium]|nr:hypothetical protein [Alphaproteobacteria bacterium]